MVVHDIDKTTLHLIRRLVAINYAGRDNLYSAAALLEDDAYRGVCRHLAECLGAHAAELQQTLLACRAHPVAIERVSRDTHSLRLDTRDVPQGALEVITAAEHSEQAVCEEYTWAVKHTSNHEARYLLERQRQNVEFGDQVLQCILRVWP